MSVPCPCCGKDMPDYGLSTLRFMRLPPYERKVLDALIGVYPRTVSVPDLVNQVYGDDPAGGPETAENAIRVYMHRLRPKLATYGWTAGGRKGVRDGVNLRPAQAATSVNEPLMRPA